MPRQLRLHFPGGLYHVTSRGNRRQVIFHDPQNYKKFESLLAFYAPRHNITIYAYCLMPNHFHLLLEVGEIPLGIFLQPLLTAYSAWLNIKTRQSGHVFQGRYHAKLCEQDRYLLALIAYIHLNPVRAKLVEDPLAWRWSSLQAFLKFPVPWIATEKALSLLAEDRGEALKRFRRDLENQMKTPFKFPRGRTSVLGSQEFMDRVKKQQAGVPPTSVISPTPPPAMPLVSHEYLLGLVSRLEKEPIEHIRGSSHAPHLTIIRRALAEATKRWWRWNLSQTAELLLKSPAAVAKMRQPCPRRITRVVEAHIARWAAHLRPFPPKKV